MATTFESKGLAEHAESNGLVKHADNNGLVDNTTSEGNTVTIINTSWRRMVYRIGDNPPLKLLLLFTLQVNVSCCPNVIHLATMMTRFLISVFSIVLSSFPLSLEGTSSPCSFSFVSCFTFWFSLCLLCVLHALVLDCFLSLCPIFVFFIV